MNKLNQHLDTIKEVNFSPLLEIIQNFQIEPLLVLFFEVFAENTIKKINFKTLEVQQRFNIHTFNNGELKTVEVKEDFNIHTLSNEQFIKTHIDYLIINPSLYQALSENPSLTSIVINEMSTKTRIFPKDYQIILTRKGIDSFLDAFFPLNHQKEVKKCR